jgi:hypothetical protein
MADCIFTNPLGQGKILGAGAPSIQAGVYDIGDPLRAALTSLGAPDQLAEGVYALEQVLPTLLEVPDDLLTNGVHFAATGLQDLVANDFDGFVQVVCLPCWDWKRC